MGQQFVLAQKTSPLRKIVTPQECHYHREKIGFAVGYVKYLGSVARKEAEYFGHTFDTASLVRPCEYYLFQAGQYGGSSGVYYRVVYVGYQSVFVVADV